MCWVYQNVPLHQTRGLSQVIAGQAEACTFIRNPKGPNRVHLSVDRDMGDHGSNMKQFFFFWTQQMVSVWPSHTLTFKSSHCLGPVTTWEFIAEWSVIDWVGRTEVWGSQLRKRRVLSTGGGFAFRNTSKYFPDVFSKPYITMPAHYLATQCSSLPFPDSTFSVAFFATAFTLLPALNPCLSTKHPAWLEWHLV